VHRSSFLPSFAIFFLPPYIERRQSAGHHKNWSTLPALVVPRFFVWQHEIKNMKDSLEPDIIVSTLRYLCRKIRGREAAMLALNLRLDEIICEILRIFPGHAGIRKWGWGVLWSLSYPKESWCPSPLSMASPVRSWRNIGGSWVVCRQRKISKRRRGISSRVLLTLSVCLARRVRGSKEGRGGGGGGHFLRGSRCVACGNHACGTRCRNQRHVALDDVGRGHEIADGGHAGGSHLWRPIPREPSLGNASPSTTI